LVKGCPEERVEEEFSVYVWESKEPHERDGVLCVILKTYVGEKRQPIMRHWRLA